MEGLWLAGVIVFGGLSLFLIAMAMLHAGERGFVGIQDDEGGNPLNPLLVILYFRSASGWLFWGLLVFVALTVWCVLGFTKEMRRMREARSENNVESVAFIDTR